MFNLIAIGAGVAVAGALAPAATTAQAVQPGAWSITSTTVDLSIPGVPGFVQHMMRGKTRAEQKRLAAGQGVETLLAPDPKAGCRVDSQKVADGRYAQVLTCPQKKGEPMHITRTGSYDAAGFTGRATIVGNTPKGPMSIVLDQRATRTGG